MNVAIAVVCKEPSVRLEAQIRNDFAARLKELRASWRFAEAESPAKAVHALRVASRRLRAFADVVEHGLGRSAGRRFRRRLGKVARAVSELRNADVLASLVERELAAATFDADRAALEHLLERLASTREAAQRKARERLQRTDLAVLSAKLSAELDAALRRADCANASLTAFGIHLVDQRLADVLDRMPRPGAAEPSEHALHRLRIAVKKLRYTAELFDGALGRRSTELRQGAMAVQEQLGSRHDLTVLIETVTAELVQLEAHGRRTLARSLRSLLAGLSERRKQPDYGTLLASANALDAVIGASP